MTERTDESNEEQEEQEEIVQVSPEDIYDEILIGAISHAETTRRFISKFMFYDKTLEQWADELAIAVPSELSPEVMRELYIKLANNIQIASHFYTVANTINSTLVGGGQIKHADLVNAIVNKYKGRRPAATVIEKMADSYMKSTNSSVVASKLVKEFWKNKLEALKEVRKCLEQLGISMHTEMKYLNEGANDN